MRDRLIELIQQSVNGCARNWAEVISDYLLENGVIVPPYKVGDTVWYITGFHRDTVKSAIVEEIIINCNGVSDLFVTGDFSSFENSVDIFYPTREATERALKEGIQK